MEPEEKETEPENKNTETQPEEKETENNPGEWPLNHGNTKEDFEKIQADVDDPSGPYNSRWEAFKDESKSDEKIKKKYEKIKATRNKIRQLIKDNDTDGEDMRKSMHTYKDALHDVIAPHTESISMTFESWVKPYHALPLFERTEYFKKLLNRG
jgi:hypothetical protein